jgi:polar amino acid transport system substrate-binding protein
MRPISWLAALLLVVGLALPATAPRAATLDEILERGTLRVGTAAFVPWAMRDSDGRPIGFEADVAERLARDMGVELELSVMGFDQLRPALDEGAIDLIAAGLSITPRRALAMGFSDPYATSGVTMLVNRELGEAAERLSDFNDPDVRLAAIRDTTAAQVAASIFPEAEIFLLGNEEELATAVQTGRVLGAVASTPFPELRRLAQPERVYMPFDEPLARTGEAFGFARDSLALKNFLDAWIVFRSLDGWLPERRRYWFGTLDWQDRLPPAERITPADAQ